jgi:hypothetical protein
MSTDPVRRTRQSEILDHLIVLDNQPNESQAFGGARLAHLEPKRCHILLFGASEGHG